MLYVAFFKIKPGLTAGSPEIVEKSRKWWDQGGKPAGLKTVGVFGCLGTDTRDVLIFEAQNHDDIREMVNFWRDTTDFEVHPAVDLAATFKQQGMKGYLIVSLTAHRSLVIADPADRHVAMSLSRVIAGGGFTRRSR
jgi:hypothetical protein